MTDIMELKGAEPRKILVSVIQQKIPAILSYQSKNKWHVAKVLLTDIGATWLATQVVAGKSQRPINVRVDQPIGVSIKYGYGKFIFDTTVITFEPSQDTAGGVISLAVPDRIEMVQRRSYFRVDVPKTMRVNVVIWPRQRANSDASDCPENYIKGSLVDISAGGLQVAINSANVADFCKGRYVCIRFTPLPYETPLMFDAQIRTVLPTVDDKSVCLGMQIVGLETSAGGRKTLTRLVNVVEQYYQMNCSGDKQNTFCRKENPNTV